MNEKHQPTLENPALIHCKDQCRDNLQLVKNFRIERCLTALWSLGIEEGSLEAFVAKELLANMTNSQIRWICQIAIRYNDEARLSHLAKIRGQQHAVPNMPRILKDFRKHVFETINQAKTRLEETRD